VIRDKEVTELSSAGYATAKRLAPFAPQLAFAASLLRIASMQHC
jgi:hypothetical protein